MSRAENINLNHELQQDHDSPLANRLMPNLSCDIPINNQNVLQPVDTWELELIGEDRLSTNSPTLSSIVSVHNSPPYKHVSLANQSITVAPTAIANGVRVSKAPILPQGSPDQNTLILTNEITLLRHFVDFAVPPILIGLEPRWNACRDALVRLSKNCLHLRHAICAFSALSLGESPGSQIIFYCGLAKKELTKLLDEEPSSISSIDSYEGIQASVFFVSYVEVIVSNIPESSVKLLDRAYTLLKTKPPINSTLYKRLNIWLQLLDAKVISARGKGIRLHTNPDTQNLDILQESLDSTPSNDDPDGFFQETEEILFISLNRPAYNFYLQVLNISCRIARLDKWHRSRGSVHDEMEVMLAAEKIVRDLNALWTRRPAIIDPASRSEQLRRYIASGLAGKIEAHLRSHTSNFHACFIQLQRVAYAHLRAIAQVSPAVTNIAKVSKMSIDEGHALPVSMLWPLMMAACEAEDEDTKERIIRTIECMNDKVGNATRTAKLVREIVRRQMSGQRADARTVMQEAFGEVFAIM